MKKKKIIILSIIILVIIALRLSPIGNYLSFQNFVQNKQQLLEFINNNYLISIIFFTLLYFFTTLFFLPIAAILTIAGGFLFGVIPATVFVNISSTSGAVAAFIASRYLIGDWVQEKYKNKLIKFNKELKKNGAYYLFTLRLIPIFPFFLINVFAGLTKLRLSTFFWTTALGIIPGSVVYTFAGKQLSTINKPSDVLSFNILRAFLLLILLSLLPVIYKKLKAIFTSSTN